jgi:hypothetical protein
MVSFLIDSKKEKSDGSQVSSKDYDRGGYLLENFEFDPFDKGFTQQEFDSLLENLNKITTNIKKRVEEKKGTAAASVSSNTGEEISIVQDEIWKLCECLCFLYRKHSKEDISFTSELSYSDNGNYPNNCSSQNDKTSSSSINTISTTNKNGRIGYTFHGHRHLVSLSLGLLECKNTNKQVYSQKDRGILTSDGKKSITQSFIQLKSQVNKLISTMNVNPRLFVCLLTTGKKWMVLKRKYYQGQTFFHSQEVELLSQDGTLPEPNSEPLQIVTKMLFYFLFSLQKVDEDIEEIEAKFEKVRKKKIYSFCLPS